MTKLSTHPTYRSDIDGLRAIAVLSVVGYHAFPSLIRGGFIGVDIFFVISGFLISTIIIQNAKCGSFSFRDFYSRRIKRIFPALITVLIAVLILGWFTLFPDEYKQLGKHVVAGAGFLSNFVLWGESNYFDVSSEIKPLLHLWSLGIEEQFYIFWPLLVWGIWRLRLNLLSVMLLVGLISFALNIYDLKIDPVAVFYSPQTRFWELLVGSVLAYISLRRGFPSGRPIRNSLSALGSMMVLFGIFHITNTRAFPGWLAMLPTIGSALIISSGSQAWINRKIYSSKVLVWFGLISFPLYLWHWPILSFARIFNGETPPREVRLVAVVLAIILAWLTYVFIEKPIRFPKKPNSIPTIKGRSSKNIVVSLCTLMVCVGMSGLVIFKYNGLDFRNERVKAQLAELPWNSQFRDLAKTTGDCLPVSIREQAYIYTDGTIRCRQTIANDPIQKIALIGDSHAEHLFWGLSKTINQKQNLVYFTYSCLPFLGLKRLLLQDCEKMQQAIEYVIKQPSIHTVILSAYWEDRMTESDIKLQSDLVGKDNEKMFGAGLSTTIKALNQAGKSVVFAFDVPSLDFEPTNCIRPSILGGGKCAISRSKVLDDQSPYRIIAEKVLEKNPMVKQWDPMDYFCDKDTCNAMENGKFLYRDRSHVTDFGSESLAKSLVQKIN